MSDNLPGHTCPAIDDLKRRLRRLAREVPGVDPVELDAMLSDLEQLRADNLALREGYARARADRGKCSHCGRWG